MDIIFLKNTEDRTHQTLCGTAEAELKEKHTQPMAHFRKKKDCLKWIT